jgi:hypothetical protein
MSPAAEEPTTGRAPAIRVRTLMIATAVVAVFLWLKLQAPAAVAFVAVWAVALWAIARGIPRAAHDPSRRADAILFPVIAASAVAAEWQAAQLSFFTLGEVDAALRTLAIGLNLPAIGLLLGGRRRWAYGWIAAVFLVLVPDQLALLGKWTLADRETRRVVQFVTAEHARTGTYPADLIGYAPASPLALGWVVYRPDPQEGFIVSYHLGSENTSHFYTPTYGWGYDSD